jgi:hypothetical protein
MTLARELADTAGRPQVDKNLLINGGMNVWQRSTSASVSTDTYATVDRFAIGVGGMGVFTSSRSTDVPSGQGFGYSTKWDCTTADASPAAGDYIIFPQRLEGQNLQHLLKGTSSAKAVTVSFWIKSNKTGTYILELIDADNARNISKSYTIDTANTWEKKEIVFEGDQTGVLDNDNAHSLRCQWWFGAGSTFSSGTLQTSWATGVNANRAVGQVNLADSTSNELYITGCQLEIGEAATDFQFEPYEKVHNKCLRYFVQDVFAYAGTMGGGSANVPLSIVQFPVRMRQAPTVTWISGGTVSDGQYDSTISSQNTTQNINPFSCRVLFNRNTSGTPSVVGRGCDIRGVTMKYDAEL